MISILPETINDIPSLVVVREQDKETALPVLIYCHGFTSAKEHNLPIAYLLAEKGYRVVLPDSLYHGERAQNMSQQDLQLAFWDIVIQNVADIQSIHHWLQAHELLLNERLGLAGTSMGGITAAGALTRYSWIKAAAIMMGTPNLSDYAELLIDQYRQTSEADLPDEEIERVRQAIEPLDLARHPESLDERPLFFWHSEKDPVIPYTFAYDFYKQVVQQYEHLDRVYFLKEKDGGHKVSRFGMLAAVRWLDTYL